jgi:hypothetical protein
MTDSHPLQDETPSTDSAKLQHAQLARKVASLLADTSGLGARLAHAAPANGTNGLEHIDLELTSYFAHSYELGRRLQRQTFSVAVLALAKSGKIDGGSRICCGTGLVPTCFNCDQHTALRLAPPLTCRQEHASERPRWRPYPASQQVRLCCSVSVVSG